MQVDRVNPVLKPPGTVRLKLKCDILLSASAFKFKSRRYNEVLVAGELQVRRCRSTLSSPS